MYHELEERHLSCREFRITDTMPLFCGLVAFKYFYNYYQFAFPMIAGLCSIVYTVITLCLFMLFLPVTLLTVHGSTKSRVSLFLPALLIPLAVILNISYVIIQTGNLGILSRSYILTAAFGTNDEKGYYFSQLNTWFGNMTVVLLLYKYIQSRKQIAHCICACILVMIVPVVAIILQNPGYLGTRSSTFDNSDVVFGGGLWNIGVVYFGSLFWLSQLVYPCATKKQKRMIRFATVFFPAIGIAGLSRTLIMMISISMAYFFIISRKTVDLVKKTFLVIALVLLIMVLESNIVTMLLERFTDSTSGGNNIRILLWKAYGRHIGEYWLLGAPEGSVYRYYRDINRYGAYFLPHSALLNFLIRFGVVGCLAYVELIIKSFGITEKVPRDEKVYLISACLSYIALAFINQTGYAEPIFYIMFGLLLGCRRMRGEGRC